MCLCFRSLTQHWLIGSRGDLAGKKHTSPNNCSPHQRRQFCMIGLVSIPQLQSPWTYRAFKFLHPRSLASNQARIGSVGTRSISLMFLTQGPEVLIQSGHKTLTHQTLQVFMTYLRQFMTHTPISCLNTSGTWMRRDSSLVEGASDQKNIFTSGL